MTRGDTVSGRRGMVNDYFLMLQNCSLQCLKNMFIKTSTYIISMFIVPEANNDDYSS